MSDKPYKAPALEKGIAIIELLARSPVPLSMMEIGDALSRSKHELYRMLISLEDLNWLVRVRNEKFQLTNRLFDIAMSTPPRRNLHQAALDVMQELSNSVFQSCHLAVASDNDVVVVGRIESPTLLGFSVRLGHRRPVTGSTSGRVLYGCATEELKDAWRPSLKRRCDRATFESFLADSEHVRKSGVLTMSAEFVQGVTDMSVPLYDRENGAPAAALTLPYLKSGYAKISLEETRSLLVKAGKTISQKLTYGE